MSDARPIKQGQVLTGPLFTEPVRRLTPAEVDNLLEKAADILRQSADSSEFRDYVVALLFFKRISDVYEEEVRRSPSPMLKLFQEQGPGPGPAFPLCPGIQPGSREESKCLKCV